MEPQSVKKIRTQENNISFWFQQNQEFKHNTVHRLHTFPQVMFPHDYVYLKT